MSASSEQGKKLSSAERQAYLKDQTKKHGRRGFFTTLFGGYERHFKDPIGEGMARMVFPTQTMAKNYPEKTIDPYARTMTPNDEIVFRPGTILRRQPR